MGPPTRVQINNVHACGTSTLTLYICTNISQITLGTICTYNISAGLDVDVITSKTDDRIQKWIKSSNDYSIYTICMFIFKWQNIFHFNCLKFQLCHLSEQTHCLHFYDTPQSNKSLISFCIHPRCSNSNIIYTQAQINYGLAQIANNSAFNLIS